MLFWVILGYFWGFGYVAGETWGWFCSFSYVIAGIGVFLGLSDFGWFSGRGILGGFRV